MFALVRGHPLFAHVRDRPFSHMCVAWLTHACTRYSSLSNLARHISHNQRVEKQSAPTIKGCHDVIDVAKLVSDNTADDLGSREAYAQLTEFWSASDMEIVCIFEAIDPLMSGSFQSLQSYTVDDIAFGGEFKSCVRAMKGSSAANVELDDFHSVVYPDEGQGDF